MLKKLRLKFILINMIIVTIMLGVIFAVLYFSTSTNLERESIQMMQSLANSPTGPVPPDKPQSQMHLPYFSVLLNREGELIDTEGNIFSITNQEQLNHIIFSIFDSKLENGILKEYNLRFLRTEAPMGTHIVFIDMTSEQSTLNNLIRTFLLIGSAAFLVFLAISIFLARWAVKPVEKAWQQQKQFIADASHELKTPLTVIMTDAELLHAPDCPDEDRKPLSEGILTMSLQMRGLIENLLNLARIDNGSVKEEFSLVSFSDIVTNSVMIFEPVFFEKGLSLKSEIESDIQINGIPSHLKQLINILLDNAVKYSSVGGETIVRLNRYTHKRLLLDIANQGESISDEDIKNIFKRFYRADKARAMNQSYGLGLSIAQGIVTEHHGKIWVASKDGYNHFYVELFC